MNYWLISDTHFNHTRLEQWGHRSGHWQETLWQGLQNIPADDILIHLGDVAIGEEAAANFRITATPARSKILVLGNHDRYSAEWYLDKGWSFVCEGLELLYTGHHLWLSHRPQPPMDHFTQNIHGHTHGNQHRAEEYAAFYDESYHKDISPELVGFQALRLDTLVKEMRKKVS